MKEKIRFYDGQLLLGSFVSRGYFSRVWEFMFRNNTIKKKKALKIDKVKMKFISAHETFYF